MKVFSYYVRMNPFLHQTLFTIHETPVTPFNLIGCLALLVCSFLLAKWIRSLVIRLTFFQSYMSPALLYAIGRLVYYGILLVGIYVSLIAIGIDLTGIAVIIGALSVGIGFGLQSVFNNFVAGVILLIERKVRVNDLIELDSNEIGIVVEINVRSTLIRTLDNRKIIIPNTDIVYKKLVNWTLKSNRCHRFRIPFAVGREFEKEKIKGIALEIVGKIPFTSEKYPSEIWLTEVKEKIQRFELIVWVEQKNFLLTSQSISASYLWALDSAFLKQGISMIEANRHIASKIPVQEL